ncbi:hypothetical protein D910_03293 [Dendroctonus ponderosae]|uniref:Uncharacterized protein n=1 Tax=Dendroctonus ponderosae TaxID=77166 RepID=U4U0T2_DENPD|nr:hypothetical protein D910_03293 [Dendroctonus ponderosae]
MAAFSNNTSDNENIEDESMTAEDAEEASFQEDVELEEDEEGDVQFPGIRGGGRGGRGFAKGPPRWSGLPGGPGPNGPPPRFRGRGGFGPPPGMFRGRGGPPPLFRGGPPPRGPPDKLGLARDISNELKDLVVAEAD